MPNSEPIKKYTLRIPAQLHAHLERSALASGLSLNAEMLVRLQREHQLDAAEKIFEEIRRQHAIVADGMQRQIGVLWSALDRANGALEKVADAMAQVPPDGSAAALKREVEFALELINALSAHR
ncbi:hypothetical protein [Paraburkholderia sp. D1E]|uniref:hypothetical protein n=1 Tax=Paraburkholderia sp. D1E TaxID=3461398 RepID=UPI00404575E9